MPEETSVLVYGAGGHGLVVLDAALRQPALRVIGVIDDDPARQGAAILGIKVLGGGFILSDSRFGVCRVVVAIGDAAARQRVVALVAAAGLGFVAVVHPTAFLAAGVSIGDGAAILPTAVVHTKASIASHVIVNTGAIVEHDARVAEFAHISPGARLGGGVRVERAAHIGIGASVIPGVRIGERAVVGAGAVVLTDVPDDAVVGGVPARPLRRSGK